MAEMFVVLCFAKMSSIKYIRWYKPFFFFQACLVHFWPDLPLSLPPTRKRTLSMPSNLKTSKILFFLQDIRYKRRAESRNWDSKVRPWLHSQVDHQLQRQMHLFLRIFLQFFCFWKWNLRCTFKCSMECLLKFTFYWIVLCTLLY